MNSKEFCRQNKLGEQCLEFAERNPRLAEFWDNCERPDWLLKLAHTDPTDLRGFIERIQKELGTRKIQYTNPYPPRVPEAELVSQADSLVRECRRANSYLMKANKITDQQLADWVREFCKLGW